MAVFGGLHVNRFLSAVVLFSMIGCGSEDPAAPSGGGTLQTEDLVVGTGATAANGNTVTVHYTGRFTNGTVFDSSIGGQPYTFRLGANPPQVIAGFEQGIVGMRVGGRRRLTIPPNLAYGSQGRQGIPPNSTLVFDVELLAVT
jgi:FKBP-type peptidyl-prolyl cis-trans isomerase FkpA